MWCYFFSGFDGGVTYGRLLHLCAHRAMYSLRLFAIRDLEAFEKISRTVSGWLGYDQPKPPGRIRTHPGDGFRRERDARPNGDGVFGFYRGSRSEEGRVGEEGGDRLEG